MGSGVKISKNMLQNINKDDVHTTQERAVMGNWTQTRLKVQGFAPASNAPPRGSDIKTCVCTGFECQQVVGSLLTHNFGLIAADNDNSRIRSCCN